MLNEAGFEVLPPEGGPVLRVIPELATAIGLNESIVLMQLAFWIRQRPQARDGNLYRPMSIGWMREWALGFLSAAALSRVLANLERAALITRANFNKHAYDRTYWYALDLDAIEALGILRVIRRENSIPHTETPISQNEKWIYHPGTTIQKDSPKKDTKPKEPTKTPAPPPPAHSGGGQDTSADDMTLEESHHPDVRDEALDAARHIGMDAGLARQMIAKRGAEAVKAACEEAAIRPGLTYPPRWAYAVLRDNREWTPSFQAQAVAKGWRPGPYAAFIDTGNSWSWPHGAGVSRTIDGETSVAEKGGGA
ncbi:hypothetical protein HC928_01375 [bacterium]|nr:hypothetical protein [bacterium]